MSEENPSPPVPPSQEILAARQPSAPPPPGVSQAADLLQRRLEKLESELSKERGRAREAEHLLRQQGEVRGEVDRQLKALLEQLKAEKTQREREEEKSHAQGRIESLEKRLDEMHQSWMTLLKESVAKQDAGSGQVAVQSAASAAGIRALSESLAAAREEISSLREGQARIPPVLQQTVSQIGAMLGDRMADLDRKITAEVRRYEEASAAWTRERAALAQALEEQRHQIRQEYDKAHLTLQSSYQECLEELKRALEKLEKGQEKDSQSLAGLKGVLARTNELLSRPEKAKDQLLRDLEQEKHDLMKALDERTAALRQYTLERREAERQITEAQMDLNRRLEAERVKEQAAQSQIAELKLQLEAAHRKEILIQAIAAERDNLLRSLMESTQKLQQSAAARAESEQSWEARTAGLRRDLGEEKKKRLSSQQQVVDLEARIRALSDHIAQIVRDKEQTEGQQLQWKEEREKLLAEMRKKEDLLSMLSATFQDLLKK